MKFHTLYSTSGNTIHESKELKAENHAIELSHHEPYYLRDININEVERLQKNHGKSRQEIESIISQHNWFYIWCYFENKAAIATNLFECIFLINTAKEGIEAISFYFLGEVVLPDLAIYLIGIPWAITDLFVYSLLFSSRLEAIKSTLLYAERLPIKDRIIHCYQQIAELPAETLKHYAINLFHSILLLSCNLTESLTDIIDIPWLVEGPINVMQWLGIVTILYLGNVFYSKYTDIDYSEGLEFWVNKDNLPYLLGELSKGKILIPLQILLQGLCTIGLEAFPLSYYLAEAAQEKLGWWFPAYLSSVLATIHSLCVLYPATYLYYMENEIELNKLIHSMSAANIESDIRRKYNATAVDFDEAQIKREKDSEIERIIVQYKMEIYNTQTYGYVFSQNPELIFSTVLVMLAGSFLGYLSLNAMFISIANEKISSAVASVSLGGILFGCGFYKIEKDIYNSKLAIKKIKYDADISTGSLVETKTSGRCMKVTNALAMTFNLGSNFLGFASIIGSEARLNSHPKFVFPTVVFAAAQRMSNNIIFLKDKLESNINETLGAIQKRAKRKYFGFFECSKNLPENIPTYVSDPASLKV